MMAELGEADKPDRSNPSMLRHWLGGCWRARRDPVGPTLPAAHGTLHKAFADRLHRRFGSRVHVQLAKNARNMVLHGLLGE